MVCLFLIFHKNFGVQAVVRIFYIFPLLKKLFEYTSRRAFFFIKLKFKLYQIHLIRHSFAAYIKKLNICFYKHYDSIFG